MERAGGEHRAGPGAEILAGELLARDVLQVGIHVVRLDAPRFAAVVDIAEELLARQILHAPHDRGEPAVVELHRVLDAALAPKAAFEPRPLHSHLPLAQRGRPPRLLLAGLLLL